MPSRSRRCFLFLLFMLITAFQSLAGPVQSPNHQPISFINQKGDFLIAGNWKILIKWQDRYLAKRLENISDRTKFTGALAERDANNQHKSGVICAGRELWFYIPEANPINPNGTLQNRSIDFHVDDPLADPLLCTMDRKGNWAVFDQFSGTLTINDQMPIKFGRLSKSLDISVIGNGFLLTDLMNAKIWYVSREGNSIGLDWPFPQGDETSQIKIRQNLILYGNSDNFLIAEFDEDGMFHSNGKDWLKSLPQKLKVSPCEEEQRCAISLGYDRSWVILGHWGGFYGKFGEDAMRVPWLFETGRGSQASFAHNSLNGRFVFVGPLDGDMGSMTRLLKRKGSSQPSGALPIEHSSLRAEDLWWQWSLHQHLAWKDVHDAGLFPAEIKVAVVDSGVHQNRYGDLEFLFARNENEIPENLIDDDQNGFIDDVFGYDFVGEDSSPEDLFGHGSHVAGLLGSRLINQNQFSPAPNVRLVVVRVLDQNGQSNAIDLARGINYAVNQGVEFINGSWGGGRSSFAIEEAIENAVNHGVILFTSAGNDSLDHDRYPQSPGIYPGVFSVGAIHRGDNLAKFSNFGVKSVHFLAPGEDILSASKDGHLALMSGTSMASPLALASLAWITGLIKTRYPVLSMVERTQVALQILCDTARPTTPRRSRCGIVDMAQASREVMNYTHVENLRHLKDWD